MLISKKSIFKANKGSPKVYAEFDNTLVFTTCILGNMFDLVAEKGLPEMISFLRSIERRGEMKERIKKVRRIYQPVGRGQIFISVMQVLDLRRDKKNIRLSRKDEWCNKERTI